MDKNRKKQRRKYIAWGCAAVAVFALAVMPILASREAASDGPQASILSTEVTRRDIGTQIIGGGQLAGEAALAVHIPQAVKLTGYLVRNGDTVAEGDPIAAVDKVSVMTAITQVQETLDYLSAKITDAAGETGTSTVKALTGGTVKAVYARAGEAAQDVMLEHGALAVLSLDGLMAVQITRSTSLAVGDTVCVTLEDGSEREGRVKSNLDGVLTVTIPDEGFSVGEKAIVTTEDGSRVGMGELYIHSPWNAAAYSGTVSAVRVSEGDTVSAGSALITLSDSGSSAEYQRLIDERHDYEELMQELFTLYRTETVAAPCGGIVTGVDEDGAFLLSGETEGPEAEAVLLPLEAGTASGSSGIQVVLLSSMEAPGVLIVTQALDDGRVGEAYSFPLQATEGASGTWSATGLPAGISLDPASGVISGTPEQEGVYSVTVRFAYGEGTAVTKDFTLTIAAAQEGPVYRGYAALVVNVTEGTLQVLQTADHCVITDLNQLPTLSPSTADMTVEAVYTSELIHGDSLAAGDILLLVVDENGSLVALAKQPSTPGTDRPDSGEEPLPGEGGSLPGGEFGGMTGGMPGGMPGGGMAQPAFEPYSLDSVTIASVTSQAYMTMEISVDELDISQIAVGQEARITLDALAGQQYAATVTEIASSGENAGGSSKFTVELTLEKSGQMLPGMNATAAIPMETTPNVLSVPVSALEESGTKTILYTSYDEKTGVLGNPVAVTTGVSDGEYVQILDGPAEGQTCYYAYYDTLILSNTPKSQGFFGR